MKSMHTKVSKCLGRIAQENDACAFKLLHQNKCILNSVPHELFETLPCSCVCLMCLVNVFYL